MLVRSGGILFGKSAIAIPQIFKFRAKDSNTGPGTLGAEFQGYHRPSVLIISLPHLVKKKKMIKQLMLQKISRRCIQISVYPLYRY